MNTITRITVYNNQKCNVTDAIYIDYTNKATCISRMASSSHNAMCDFEKKE